MFAVRANIVTKCDRVAGDLFDEQTPPHSNPRARLGVERCGDLRRWRSARVEYFEQGCEWLDRWSLLQDLQHVQLGVHRLRHIACALQTVARAKHTVECEQYFARRRVARRHSLIGHGRFEFGVARAPGFLASLIHRGSSIR
jgi:hypothetical protein